MKQVFPEDLMNVVIAADARRREALGQAPSRYRRAQRTWIEPWFNALGRVLGILTQLLPWPLRRRLYPFLCQKMGAHAPENNPEWPVVIRQSIVMAQDLRRLTGQWPAFLVVTSHPETIGPLQWLRFEQLRQAQIIANAVVEAESDPSPLVGEGVGGGYALRRATPIPAFPHQGGRGFWYRSHPQCFLAIDPYALDTVSAAVGGFYAGWMHQVFIAWDRQPSTQSWIQRHWLLRGAGHDRVAWRLLRRLRKNPVLMVLSGGLPFNARTLYAAREFVQRLKPQRWPMPKRAAEKRLMEILTEPVEGIRPAEEGDLPPKTQEKIRRFLETLGISGKPMESVLAELAREWRPAVPSRARLFNTLIRRLAARSQGGQPLMILAFSHRDKPPHIKVHSPWAVYRRPDGPSPMGEDRPQGGTLAVARGHVAASAPLDLPSFARRFSCQFLPQA